MSDVQTWAIIGVFTTIMLGGMTAMTTLITRATTSAIEGVESRLVGRVDALEGRMDGRFDAMETHIDHLDRDVSTLMRRAWGEHTGE